MTKQKNNRQSNTETEVVSQSDLVWGAGNIGREINQTERQTFFMLEKGHLPARKVGGKWVASRQRLLAFLAGDAA
ncbi:DNA-binding protein [Rhizobium puerariae]|uniref:DNA-binding protein n=1 Tax=Rhizobium puerariae TaxID=1585791 RepID=A0ABV6AM76_9HYPH